MDLPGRSEVKLLEDLVRESGCSGGGEEGHDLPAVGVRGLLLLDNLERGGERVGKVDNGVALLDVGMGISCIEIWKRGEGSAKRRRDAL